MRIVPPARNSAIRQLTVVNSIVIFLLPKAIGNVAEYAHQLHSLFFNKAKSPAIESLTEMAVTASELNGSSCCR